MQQYFKDFSDKACCFEDLKPYVSILSTPSIPPSTSSAEMEDWTEFLGQQIPQERTKLAEVNRTINAFKLRRLSSVEERSEEVEHGDAMMYLKTYFECLPVGKSFPVEVSSRETMQVTKRHHFEW